MEASITISDFRDKLKHYLDKVEQGQVILLTKRGKVVARIEPQTLVDTEVEKSYKARLKDYKNGGIQINQNIVDQPLKAYDYIDDSLYDNASLAAEPDE